MRDLIETELGHLYDWLSERPVPEWIDQAELFAWLKRRLLEHTPGPETAQTIDAVAQAVRTTLASRTETAGAVISHEAFELLVNDLSEDATLRDAAVDGMIHNAVFGLIISEILYHGIEDFMSDSKLTNSIPGAQSLFKLGQNFLNQTAPGLKDGFEKSIKEFIKNNAGRIIQNSEASMKKSLSPATIRQAAGQFWDEFNGSPIKTMTDFITPEKLPSYREVGDLFTKKLRESPVTADLLKAGLDAFFIALKDRTAADVLGEMGIDRALFLAEGAAPIYNVIIQASQTGYLENLVTRRLLAFYSSNEAATLLA